MYIFEGKELDAYGVLGLQSEATDLEVKKAYRNLSKKYHPDYNQDKIELVEKKMRVVNLAYGEIVNRRKGTYIPSNSKYQGDDGSRPDLTDNNSKKTTAKPNNGSTSNGSNKYGGKSSYDNKTYYTYSQTTKSANNSGWEHTLIFKHYMDMTMRLNADWLDCKSLHERLLKYYDTIQNKEEKIKFEMLINIFEKQKLEYERFYLLFLKHISNINLNILALKKLEDEYNEFIRTSSYIIMINDFLDKEMPFMKSVVSLYFTSIKDFNYISKVKIFITVSVLYDSLIKENINTYVNYNTNEEFIYAYDRIGKEFDLFLKKNNYNIENFTSFIKLYKLKRFLKDCCNDFRFDDNYTYRGRYTR